MLRSIILCFVIFYFLLSIGTLAQGQRGEWAKISSPVNKTLRNLYFIDAQTGWAAGEDGTIIHTTNGGSSWILQNSTVQTFIVDVFFINENLGWAISFKDVFPFGTILLKTTDGGDVWIAEDYPDENTFMNTIFFFDSLNGWIGGTYIANTTNGGVTWVEANVDSNMISSLPIYNFNFYSRQFGYACGGYLDLAGVIWRTTNFGENWSATGVSADQVFDLYIKDSLNSIALSGDPEGFFGIGNITTTNAGTNWIFKELTIPGLSFAIDFRTTAEGWSASGYKFLFTSDSGITWGNKETPDSAVIYDLTFTDSITAYAVGENGAILKYHKEIEIPPDSISSNYTLYQNYPNPFNSLTKIKYQIPKISFITIKVYDVMGNNVATLISEEKPAGNYQVDFNASKNSSGVYIYRLQAGSFGESRKMVLLK